MKLHWSCQYIFLTRKSSRGKSRDSYRPRENLSKCHPLPGAGGSSLSWGGGAPIQSCWVYPHPVLGRMGYPHQEGWGISRLELGPGQGTPHPVDRHTDSQMRVKLWPSLALRTRVVKWVQLCERYKSKILKKGSFKSVRNHHHVPVW